MKELQKMEIENQCKKYDSECRYLGSHVASESELSDMLSKIKPRMCSYT